MSNSAAEESGVSNDTTQNKQESTSILQSIVNCFKICGLCCKLLCPPIPYMIVRKSSVHPPPKGMHYRLKLKESPNKNIKNAKQVFGKEFYICPERVQTEHSLTTEVVMRVVQPFVLKTPRNNHLVVVKASPLEYSKENTLRKQVLIFAQPNSSDLGMFLHSQYVNVKSMAEYFQMDVYAFDYSGFGYSTGKPDEFNLYCDIRTVYEHVRMEQPDKKIVLLGFSIGTTAVTDLAATNPEGLAGLILIAPFTSGLRLLGNTPSKEKSCCMDAFRTIDKIGRVTVPVLFLHGSRDKMIPSEHSTVLHSFCQKPFPVVIIPGAGHQSIFSTVYPETFAFIWSFLRRSTDVCDSDDSPSQIPFNDAITRINQVSINMALDWSQECTPQTPNTPHTDDTNVR